MLTKFGEMSDLKFENKIHWDKKESEREKEIVCGSYAW